MSAGVVPLPKGWPRYTKRAMVHAVSLALFALTQVRGWCLDSRLGRVRLAAQNDRLRAEIALLREELRIKDVRLERIPARQRPYYPPEGRLAILMLRAARSWSASETARHFFVTAATIASWMHRLDEHGERALVKLPVPVNKFPDFVSLLVRELRRTLPSAGKVRIAQLLARSGLHLAASTVRRMLKRPLPPTRSPREGPGATRKIAPGRRVVARLVNHVWNVDVSLVPTSAGFWISWIPWSVAPSWPFCWSVVVVLDHVSRAVVAAVAFRRAPSAEDVCAVLDRAVSTAGRAPRHIISDQGPQFRQTYREWCARRGVKPRFGAVGQHGSIAVLERFWRTLKEEGFRKILVPFGNAAMVRELSDFVLWYNAHRPHQSLAGATPAEIRDGVLPACRDTGVEPRARYPLARGDPKRPRLRRLKGGLYLVVERVEDRQHLPIVSLKRQA